MSSYQVWVLQLFYHLYVVKLDIEELIDRFEGASNLDVVLELHRDFVVDQSLEEAEKQFVSMIYLAA